MEQIKLPKQFKPERGVFDGPFGPWVKNALAASKDVTADMLVPTESDLKLISKLAFNVDELGTRMAEAIMAKGPLGGQLNKGLEQGLGSLEDPPEVLREFLAYYEDLPEWSYKKELEDYLSNEPESSVAKPPLVTFLGDGYAMAVGFFVGANYPAVGQSLVATGSVARGASRMVESLKWVDATRDLRNFVPHGSAITTSAKVRVAHGFARKMIERSGQWDKEYLGEIISDFDNMIFLSGLTLVEDRLPNLSQSELNALRLENKAIHYLLGAPKELVTMSAQESKRFFMMAIAHLDDSPGTARQVVKNFQDNEYFRPTDTWRQKLSREGAFITANLLTRINWGDEMADNIGLQRKIYGLPMDSIASFIKDPPAPVKRLQPFARKAGKYAIKLAAKKAKYRAGSDDKSTYSGSYGAF